MDELRRKRCESLLQQGYALIREGNLDAALEVGTSLEALRHSGGFEVAALALAGKGDLEAAVATLQRGVAAAPSVWLNWQLLGNYLSDLERYQDAHEAYQRALSCPRRRADSIHLNLAILEGRRGRPLAALEALEAVRDPDLLDDVRSCRVWMLRDAGRPQEALALAESILQGEPPEDAQGADRWARIAGHAAAIRRSLGQDRVAARRWLYELLREAPPTTALFRALRDIDGRYSPAARRLEILVQGSIALRSPRRREVAGFFTTYEVAADTPEQALEHIREHEALLDPEDPANLSIEQVKDLGPAADEPLGVRWHSGRSYYVRDE